MRKVLLAGIAALSVLSASAAHADSLPNKMLGRWCQDDVATQTGRRVYTRGACDDLRVSQNNIVEYIEDGCDFKRTKRLSNGSYFVHAACGAAGGGIANEDMVFQLVDKQLVIITTTIRFCVSVVEPPPNVVQDTEYNPDGWLGLREGPGKQFKIITTLGGNEYLEADRTKGDWTHISNVTRLSSGQRDFPKIYQGWVLSKYVKKFPCEDETKSEAEAPEPKQGILEEKPAPGNILPEDIVRTPPISTIPGLSPSIPTIPTKCYPAWTGLNRC
jgi:hypothetical protein